jgi:DedD protein
MAKDDERPQFNPKHRIAGAIILVSLAVIFIPMLLDKSTPPPENQTLTEIPARDAPAETRVAVTPLTPDAEPATAPAPVPSAEPTAPAVAKPVAPDAAVAIATPEAKPAALESPEKKSDPTSKRAGTAPANETTEKIAKGWAVQIGTFANTANAERLRERLKGLGYAVNAESVTVEGSKAVRLRVGPYREKAAATKARTQLQKDVNIQGLVVAYP